MEGIVSFSDWEKIDLRVGQVKNVEEIEGADKLYKLTIDLGKETGKRIVCAGLKEYYKKEDLQDKKIILFVNLAPRKLKGIESQGMILAAVNSEHSEVVLISPEKDVELGSRIM
ncbi:methionine--tRNA ligase subunit beta [Candidatus Pacearchaeota archaeon CG10_big_fil_rev_8_21_14_0_10_34_12]|nr:MAG: methionine--tRNA ligase subunit beta [Candidatus Pacearchaeota archaeon CG10_big_fil_rev_8_21_14_0_10_34_12]